MIFVVTGDLDFELQVEAKNEEDAKKLVEDNLGVTVGETQRPKPWNVEHEYMEVIDCNFDKDEFTFDDQPDE